MQLIKPLAIAQKSSDKKEAHLPKKNLINASPHAPAISSIPSSNKTDEIPVDIVTELNTDIADFPYTPSDPSGWVREIASVYWEETRQLLDHVTTLKPICEFNQTPGTEHHRQWLKLSKSFKWEPIASLEDLPEYLVPDVESIKEGKESDTLSDPYRPFMIGMLGADRGSKELSWYLWLDQIKPDEALLDVIPFPQNRVVVNHNVTAYDRRYFSCEYEQIGPSTNKYIDTRSLMQIMHGISTQALGAYKGHKAAQAEGMGVPEWVNKASPSNLKDSVMFRTGREIEKTVRTNFEKLTASDLAAEMISRENVEVTPTTVVQYGCSDVQATHELFSSQWPEASRVFMTHPASWVGLTMLGGVRCYMDGLDDFIRENDAACEALTSKEISGVISALSSALIKKYDSHGTVKNFIELYSSVLHANLRKDAEEQKKRELLSKCEKSETALRESHLELASIAFEREQAKHKIELLKGGRTLADVKKSEDKEELVTLSKIVTKATSKYKKVRSGYTKILKQQADETSTEGINNSGLSVAQIEEQENALKETRLNIRALKDYIEKFKPDLADLTKKAALVGEGINEFLDWARFSSGPRKGQIKWLAELEAGGWSHGKRDAVNIMGLRWRGKPIRYEMNEVAEDENPTGTWVTDEERLPHLGGNENLGSPICNDYYRFLLGDEPVLTSAVLSQQQLLSLWKAVENTNQWSSYQSRYKEIYRKETPWGLLTTTDTLSAGAISARTTGLSAVFPKKSEKIGSDVQKLIGGGKGRIVFERDFAAQESKFLAMLVDCWKGRSLSTVWSKAVLTGAKSDKSDIHNLVATFCTNELLKLWEGDPSDCPVVNRHTGKNGLNFPSIYLSGRDTIATGLIKDADFPPDLAYLVADIFLDYLKGPDGIALEEFAMLSRIAKMPGYRTAALGRKIAHSVDFAYCPGDFHTTRSNWTIQGGCTDLLHITATVVWALCLEYEVDAFPLITVHDSLKYSILESDSIRFEKLFDFGHAVAKQCAYQGATKWARETRNTDKIPQLWCPPSDIFFEERLERDGLPSNMVSPY